LVVAVLLRSGVGSRLEHVTVAGANYQLRPVDPDLNIASFARMRGILRIVAETVLAAQLFRHRPKRDIEVLLLRIVETRAGYAGQIMQVLIAKLVLAAAVA